MSNSYQQGLADPIEQFLTFCLRGRWDPEGLEQAKALADQGDMDWNHLSRVALDCKLAPLLYLIVRGQAIVPNRVEETLSYAYYYSGARNAVLLHKLKSVLATLAKENIPVILLKGAALVERIYHNAAVRPMGDIDLLVPRKDLETALQVLSGEYQVPKSVGTFAGANTAHERQAAPGIHGYGRMAFDVNCYLVESPYSSHMRFIEWLWATAAPGEIGGCTVLELSREALILHLCAHLLMDQEEKQLLWLHDIAEVLTLYREQLHWEELLESAHRFDLVLPLRQILARLEQVWRVAVPERWKPSLINLRASSAERRFYAWFASKDQPTPRLFSPQSNVEQSALLLGYLWDNLLPEPAYMSERYRIGSNWMLPLAYPYRWYRGMRSALLESFPRHLRRLSAPAPARLDSST